MGTFLLGNFEQLPIKDTLVNWYLLYGLQGALGGPPLPTRSPLLGSAPSGQLQSHPNILNLWAFASLPSCILLGSQANACTVTY